MANSIIELNKSKTSVEKKAWEALDNYFTKRTEDGLLAAKMAIAALAVLTKDRQLDLQERMLDFKEPPNRPKQVEGKRA